MATLHVRNIPDVLYEQLRRRAEANGRSLSAEVSLMIERALVDDDQLVSMSEARRRRSTSPGLGFAASSEAELLREAAAGYRLTHDDAIPEDILQAATAMAESRGTSVSRLLAEYVRRLDQPDDLAAAPIVRRLSGSLSSDVSLDDYRRYLDQKYGDATQNPV